MTSFKEIENSLRNTFDSYEEICLTNSRKVLKAFHEAGVNETCFNSTTGYGYGDYGRDVIEKVL